MKFPKSILLLVLIILSAFQEGCKKEDIKKITGPNTLNDNAYVIDTLALKEVTNLSLTILKNNTTLRPKVGDILLGAPSTIGPYGFLRKVISVTETGTEIICVTEQSSLNKAFKELHIKATFNDSITSIKSGRVADLGESELEYKLIDNTSMFVGLKLNGSIKMKFSNIVFEYDKEPGISLPDYILLKTDLSTSGSFLEISASGTAPVIFQEKTYVEFNLPDFYFYIPITTPLGIIPLPIRCVQKVKLNGGPLSVSGKAKWKISPDVNVTLGFKYENNDFSILDPFTLNATSTPLVKTDFDIDNSMNASYTLINPVYEFTPYGADLLTAFCEAPSSISYTQQLSEPNYSLKYNFNMEAGIKQKLFTDLSESLSLSVPIKEITLLEGNWDEPHSIIVSGSGQQAQPNQFLPNQLFVNVRNSAGESLNNVKVVWTLVSGGGQISQTTNYTNTSGVATNTWRLGSSGPQQVKAEVKNSAGNNVIGSPAFFTATILCDTSLRVSAIVSGTTISASATGGAPPYTFLWSNGSTSSSINVTAPGAYTVTATDLAGCTKDTIASVACDTAFKYSLSKSTIPSNICINPDSTSNLKRYTASVSGGYPPYQILVGTTWQSGLSFEACGTVDNATIRDKIGCIAKKQ